jgi:quercetin dioxygenase-like cupin family protein
LYCNWFAASARAGLGGRRGRPGVYISFKKPRRSMNVVKVRQAVAFSPEKLKKISLFDTDNFFCDIYCFEPGQSQKVHTHEGSDKVYYVLEGRGKVTVGKEVKELVADEITLAPSGEDHGVLNDSGERLVMLVFMAPKP